MTEKNKKWKPRRKEKYYIVRMSLQKKKGNRNENLQN